MARCAAMRRTFAPYTTARLQIFKATLFSFEDEPLPGMSQSSRLLLGRPPPSRSSKCSGGLTSSNTSGRQRWLFLYEGIIVFRVRSGSCGSAIKPTGEFVFQLKIDANANCIRYRANQATSSESERPGTLAVVPVISKAAEVGIRGYCATASCLSENRGSDRPGSARAGSSAS